MSHLIPIASTSLCLQQRLFYFQFRTLFWNTKPIYEKGDGVHYKKTAEEFKKERERPEDPLDYNIFGQKRYRDYTDYFHYSDRKAANGGYSHFMNKGLYGEKRPHIYPPMRRFYRGQAVFFYGLIAFIMVGTGLRVYIEDSQAVDPIDFKIFEENKDKPWYTPSLREKFSK